MGNRRVQPKTRTLRQQFTVRYGFPVIFTRDAFNPDNTALREVLGESGPKRSRVLLVADSQVINSVPGLFPKIQCYANRHQDVLEVLSPPFTLTGGESTKKGPAEVNRILESIERVHLCRHSFVLAVGGGAVLDAAGYAAATAHRGIRLIRMPTTTLAQNDAGVGVKNGINAFGRKNFLGTFAPPFAVINDFDFLDTLPPRDLRAGIAEAIKVALVRDRDFFDYLHGERRSLFAFEPDIMETMITRCAELHMEHIGTSGDPFENGSARPLDFGHWSAHKIEELTGGEIKHGEAVAIGAALDSLYSFHMGLLEEAELRKILVTLEDVGFDLYHPSLRKLDIEGALSEFQEHLGGVLTITLLDGIGSKVDVNRIDAALMEKCINILRERKTIKEKTHVCTEEPDVLKKNIGHLLPG